MKCLIAYRIFRPKRVCEQYQTTGLQRFFPFRSTSEKVSKQKILPIAWDEAWKQATGRDMLGNEYTIRIDTDHRFYKVMQIDELNDFMFAGELYSYEILSRMSMTIKVYYCECHSTAKLQRDIYGRLMLYFFDEEIDNSGNICYEYNVWMPVKDEEDADQLLKSTYMTTLLHIPHISAELDREDSRNGYWVKTKEYLDDNPVVDIHSGGNFPANVLSNLYPSEFTFYGHKFHSMEGLLQGLKTKSARRQKCTYVLSGIEAKRAGEGFQRKFDGRRLYWNGKVIDRFSDDYKQLLREAYRAKYEQDALFRFALESTGNKQLVHSIGKQNPSETILTEKEFITLLDELRCL